MELTQNTGINTTPGSGLVINSIVRKFTFNDIVLPDPGIDYSPEEVRDVYSAQYPDISTAILEETFLDSETIAYKFVRAVGSKG